MANSPHPVLLGPVSEELTSRGHDLVVTAREHGQTVALARRQWGDIQIDGSESPGSRLGKARNIGRRVATLRRRVRGRVDVALGMNSYAQVVAARSLGVPSATLMDYEHQPANHLAFRLATRVVVPDGFPQDRLSVYGARSSRVREFAGYKEEFY